MNYKLINKYYYNFQNELYLKRNSINIISYIDNKYFFQYLNFI